MLCTGLMNCFNVSGADVNAQGSNGYTALHYAAQQGNLKMAECLLNAGANVGLRASFHDHADVTALHLAAQVILHFNAKLLMSCAVQ